MSGVPITAYRPADGDHLCSLWTDPSTDRDAAAAFLARTPERERAVWILDRSRDDDLGTPGDPGATRYTTDQAHLVGGWFDPGRMRQFWRDRADEAQAAGAAHLRAVAEMAWALRGAPGTDEAPQFESSLNPLFQHLPASVICQYGSARFSAETLLAMALSHPLIVVGRHVFPNPFAVDDAFFGERFAALRSDSRAALVPIWKHFLAWLGTAEEIARFLCNSLPSLVGAERVWASLGRMSDPLELDVSHDRVTAADAGGWEHLDREGRLCALWPTTGSNPGGMVRQGTLGNLAAVEIVLSGGAGRIVAARHGWFAQADLARLVTVGTAVAAATGRLGALPGGNGQRPTAGQT